MEFDIDTIVAQATARGIGGIGIVRVSGPLARAIYQAMFPQIEKPVPRMVYTGKIMDGTTLLDTGCVVFFEAPNSYTGEDIIEFHCHGSEFIIESVIRSTIKLGARLANRGEFTQRAFINGKMNLSQAESVIDLIESKSSVHHSVALAHNQGKLWQHITKIRSELLHILENIEGALDFPLEVPGMATAELRNAIQNQVTSLDTLFKINDFGTILHRGIQVTIIGCPNAGKSSLLNQLAGCERAIVTNIPGTTRDFIECSVTLNDIVVQFTDTAGIRPEMDPIERKGIQKISGLFKKSDAIVWVIDGNQPWTPATAAIVGRIPRQIPVYILINKSDQRQRLELPKLSLKVAMTHRISAKSGMGIDGFCQQLINDFTQKWQPSDAAFICNVRQRTSLESAHYFLKSALAALEIGFEDDIAALDIKSAVMALGEVTGDNVNEAVLDGIFSRFCVGK